MGKYFFALAQFSIRRSFEGLKIGIRHLCRNIYGQMADCRLG